MRVRTGHSVRLLGRANTSANEASPFVRRSCRTALSGARLKPLSSS